MTRLGGSDLLSSRLWGVLPLGTAGPEMAAHL